MNKQQSSIFAVWSASGGGLWLKSLCDSCHPAFARARIGVEKPRKNFGVWRWTKPSRRGLWEKPTWRIRTWFNQWFRHVQPSNVLFNQLSFIKTWSFSLHGKPTGLALSTTISSYHRDDVYRPELLFFFCQDLVGYLHAFLRAWCVENSRKFHPKATLNYWWQISNIPPYSTLFTRVDSS